MSTHLTEPTRSTLEFLRRKERVSQELRAFLKHKGISGKDKIHRAASRSQDKGRGRQ